MKEFSHCLLQDKIVKKIVLAKGTRCKVKDVTAPNFNFMEYTEVTYENGIQERIGTIYCKDLFAKIIPCIAKTDVEIGLSGVYISKGMKVGIIPQKVNDEIVLFTNPNGFILIVYDNGKNELIHAKEFKTYFDVIYPSGKIEIIEPDALAFRMLEVMSISHSILIKRSWIADWRELASESLLFINALQNPFHDHLHVITPIDEYLIHYIWELGYEISVISKSFMTTLSQSSRLKFYVKDWYAYTNEGVLEQIPIE